MESQARLTDALAETALAIATQADRLEGVLQLEREALVANDDRTLDSIARDKDLIVRTLETQERERLHLARALDISPGPAPMHAALAEHGAARDAWARCVGVLERCQAINSANGRIVEIKLQNVRTALDLLSGRDMATSATTYGPTGRAARVHSPLTIARA